MAPAGGGLINAVATTTVARVGSQKVKGSSLSIATKVTAPAAGRVVANASGTVKIKGVRTAIKLTSATATIAPGQSATLTLKPQGAKKTAETAVKKIKNAVKRGQRVIATITIKIVDAAGNTRDVMRTVKLTT
jgi:RNA 3'-terminal phosphate cyclase